MRRCVIAVVGAAMLAVASARCPNSCSGHGDCGSYDKCACWPNWQGFDCSERTCEFDVAWATDYRQDAHYYAECSGKGLCDRTTGLCVCFDGYTGSACKRSVCPNDCSGHGKCRLVSELADATRQQSLVFDTTDSIATGNVRYAYTGWDGDKIQACVCDGGFFGPDCSQRYCPKGDDPLTTCSEQAPGVSDLQVQTLIIATAATSGTVYSGNGLNFPSASSDYAGDLVLHFTDNHGEVWTTGRIEGLIGGTTDGTSSAALIKSALTALPNFKIPDVTVGAGTGGGAASIAVTYTVTFDNQRTSGDQQLLACDPLPLGCMTVGCAPKYQQINNFHKASYGGTVADVGKVVYSNGGADFLLATGGADTSAGSYAAAAAVTYASAASLFTGDSVLDNSASGLGADAAYARIVFALPGNSGRAYYFVIWSTSAAPTAVVPTGTTPYSTPQLLPTGFDSGSASAYEGTIATTNGVGSNRVPIGYGMYMDLNTVFTTSPLTADLTVGAVDQMYSLDVYVSTVHCEVTETTRSDVMYEDAECSGRGTCDRATGVCTCFDGHYGDHCGMQTILV